MSVLSSLKLVEFKPVTPSAEFNRRRKLIEKIDEQIHLANDPAYTPTKARRVKGEDGIERVIEAPKRIKCWWHKSLDGRVLLTLRYGSRPLELAKGKAAIECENVTGVAATLTSIKQAVADGELDELLENQVGFGRKTAPNHTTIRETQRSQKR